MTQSTFSIRPPQSSANTADRFVLGIDIGGSNLRLALANSNAKILDTWAHDLRQTPDPTSVISLIKKGAHHLLSQSALPHSSLAACAAGVPGITDADRGIVLATSYLLGWRDVPLQALLEEALGIPAAIDNDVNIAAVGEFNATAHGTRNFVFLAIGTGIGSGIVINGQVHRGETFSAGEIGYMLVPGVSEIPAGKDMPGALESRVGGTGIEEQWRVVWNPELTQLPKDAVATAIFTEAASGGALASEVMNSSARILAYAIYNTALILDCRLFVLGGGAGTHPAFLASVQQHLNARNPYAPISVVASTLGPAAQLAGAVHVALAIAERHTAALLSKNA